MQFKKITDYSPCVNALIYENGVFQCTVYVEHALTFYKSFKEQRQILLHKIGILLRNQTPTRTIFSASLAIYNNVR